MMANIYDKTTIFEIFLVEIFLNIFISRTKTIFNWQEFDCYLLPFFKEKFTPIINFVKITIIYRYKIVKILYLKDINLIKF